MGSNVYWLEKNRVFLAYHWDTMPIEDLLAASHWAIELVEESDQPLVHMIVDMRELVHFPKQLNELMKAVPILSHKRIGWVIMISNHKLINFLSNILTHAVGRNRFRSFDNAEDALAHLKLVDPEVDRSLQIHHEREHRIPERFKV